MECDAIYFRWDSTPMRLNFELTAVKIGGRKQKEQRRELLLVCGRCLYKNQFSLNNSGFGSRLEKSVQ